MSKAFTKAAGIGFLAKEVATGGNLATSKLHLYTSGQPGIDAAAADFVECTFTGYPAGGLALTAWGAPFYDPDQNLCIVVTTHQFQATDGLNPNIIKGYWIGDGTGNLMYACDLDTPFNMVDETSALVLDVEVPYGIELLQ
jgi:hypothetical protein